MTFQLDQFVARCAAAARTNDAQSQISELLREAVQYPDELAVALAGYSNIASLEDLVIYRDETLTLLHALVPPGFSTDPHNHNLWSVIAVYDGQEDNRFFEYDGDRLVETRRASLVAPDLLANAPEVIHAIHNPRDTTLRAIHAYGGDLLATPRSSWDVDTHEEIAYDWRKVANQ